jgi:hypothetical protein
MFQVLELAQLLNTPALLMVAGVLDGWQRLSAILKLLGGVLLLLKKAPLQQPYGLQLRVRSHGSV